MPQTLDQQRARAAWAATEAADVKTAYASLCSGAPVMILTNGLGPALAFWLAKGKDEHTRLTNALAAWLLRTGEDADTGKKGRDLMKELTEADANAYRRHTAEALAYLNWLKRFADARRAPKATADAATQTPAA